MGDDSDETPADPDAEPVLEVTSRGLSAAVVVTAAGEIDLSTAEHLAAAVRAALGSRSGAVVVDLLGVEFMGSQGLAVLAEAERSAAETGQRLTVVVGEHHPVVRPLTTSGLARHLRLFPDLDAALVAIHSGR